MAKLYNSVTEAIALKALCSSDQKISGYFYSQVREDFFYNEEAKEVFKFISAHVTNKGEPPSFKLLSESLKVSEGAREFLKSGAIPAVTTSSNSEQVVGQLDQYRKTRDLYTLATQLLKKLEQPKIDPDTLINKVADRLARVHTRRTTEKDLFHLGKDSNGMALVEDILYSEDTDQVIPTGFKTFDNVNGGFFRGSLVILASSSGGGKSLTANQLALNQARLGYKVALVPLEMTESETYARTMANLSRMSSTDINLKRLATGERDAIWRKMRKLDREIATAGGRYTIYKPREDLTIEELMASIHSLASDVIYVDYISLLKGADGEDQWRKLGQIARFCKIYAENHNKVVVLLCQLSEDGRVRYSQAIKEHASLAWTWVATKDAREKGYMNVELLKARNQVMSPFTLKVDYAHMSVTDLDPSELQTITEENQRKERQTSKSPKESFTPSKKSSESDESDYLPDRSA